MTIELTAEDITSPEEAIGHQLTLSVQLHLASALLCELNADVTTKVMCADIRNALDVSRVLVKVFELGSRGRHRHTLIAGGATEGASETLRDKQ